MIKWIFISPPSFSVSQTFYLPQTICYFAFAKCIWSLRYLLPFYAYEFFLNKYKIKILPSFKGPFRIYIQYWHCSINQWPPPKANHIALPFSMWMIRLQFWTIRRNEEAVWSHNDGLSLNIIFLLFSFCWTIRLEIQ